MLKFHCYRVQTQGHLWRMLVDATMQISPRISRPDGRRSVHRVRYLDSINGHEQLP